MTETHPRIGELTVENVDRYLARLARKRIESVLLNEGGLNADTVTLRTGPCGVSVREVLDAMIADGTVVRLNAAHDADGNLIRPRGLYLNPDGSEG